MKQDEAVHTSKTHHLKTWTHYFHCLLDGKKRFEIRKNDRDFHVGDTLILQEYDPTEQKYTGREMSATVTFLLLEAVSFGLMDGYCIMSIEPEALSSPSVEKWISVEERLPESGQCVMIYSPISGVAEGAWLSTTNQFEQWRWNHSIKGVTHWMPLPEPPKQ